MFNRMGQLRSRKKLQGEQLDISFPRRGRPTKFRRLERAGQMRLDLQRPTAKSANKISESSNPAIRQTERNACHAVETIDSALDYLFPVGPMTEDELSAEFHRLFD